MTEVDHYRTAPLVQMLRKSDHGVSNCSQHIHWITTTLKSQQIVLERDQKVIRGSMLEILCASNDDEAAP